MRAVRRDAWLPDAPEITFVKHLGPTARHRDFHQHAPVLVRDLPLEQDGGSVRRHLRIEVGIFRGFFRQLYRVLPVSIGPPDARAFVLLAIKNDILAARYGDRHYGVSRFDHYRGRVLAVRP